MKGLIFSAAALALTLSACGTTDRCASAPNPTECRAWSDAGGDIDDYLVGGMVGYMLANRGGQTVIVQNPSYRGPPRQLRRHILSQDKQIAKLKTKVERQRTELRRQQEANRIAKTSTYKPSGYKPSSGGGFRSSTRPRGRR